MIDAGAILRVNGSTPLDAGFAMPFRSLFPVLLLALLPSLSPAATAPPSPLRFEPDRGQLRGQADFVVRGAGYGLWLASQGPTLRLHDGDEAALLRWNLIDARAVPARGEGTLSSRSHYLALHESGVEPAEPVRDVPHFARVRYRGAWPGIDVVYYGTDAGELEYDFVVAPGADPARISFTVEGTERIALAHDGALALHTPAGVLEQRPPVVYQVIDDERVAVEGRFLLEQETVRFALGPYDRTRELVIDPVLVWSSYLGGNADDQVFDIAERNGFVYAVGRTVSANFPIASALDPSHGGNADCFVTKFAANGGSLIYSTYLGGSGNDFCNGIAVDADGEAYVVGIQASNAGDAFLAKLTANGSAFAYPVVLRAGAGVDQAVSVAVTSAGDARVVGYTDSSDFPTTAGVAQVADGPGRGAFAFRVDAAGTLLWSTYLDGAGDQSALGVAIDGAGDAYVGGRTTDLDAAGDGFVVKLGTAGNQIAYPARVAGNGADVVNDVQVDGAGRAFVTGYTESSNLPTTPGVVQATHTGDRDAFVGKFNPEGTTFAWLTYLGGLRAQIGNALRRDTAGNVYVTGRNDLGDPNGDAFLIKLGPDATHVQYNLQFGGSGSDAANGVAIAPDGDAWIGGITTSTDFVTTAGAHDRSHNGALDGFVMKIGQELATPIVTTVVTSVQVPGTAGGPNGANTSPAITMQPGDRVTIEPVGGTVEFHAELPDGGGPGTNPGGPQGPGDPTNPDPRPAPPKSKTLATPKIDSDGDGEDDPPGPGELCVWEVGPGGYLRTRYVDRPYCHPQDDVAIPDPINTAGAGHAGLFRPAQAGIGPTAQFIGNESRTFSYTGAPNGVLKLGVNDHNGSNNRGHFDARVTVVSTDAVGPPVPVSYLTVDSPSRVEGNSGSASLVFTVSLDPPRPEIVRVRVRTSDRTATAGSDYTAVDQLLVFAQNEPSKQVSVPILGDASVEPDERFGLELVNPENAGTVRPRGTGTILSDDRPSVSVAGASCAEANTGTTTCAATVSLSAPATQPVSVKFATFAQGAGAPTDYAAITGQLVTFDVGGATSRTVPVSIVGDYFIEGSEQFRALIFDASNATLGTSTATMTIVDNDQAGSISVPTGTLQHSEAAGTVTLTIARGAGLGAGPDVNYAILPGTATMPADYAVPAGASGTVTFAGGEASKTVSVALSPDALDEDDETFSLVLSSPTDGATLGNATSLRRILDDDASPSLRVEAGGCSIVEGNAGNATCAFVVRVHPVSGRAVTFNTSTASVDATAGSDYVSQAETARSISAGQTTLTIPVTVLGDLVDEPNEQFRLNVGGIQNAIGVDLPATGTILDDDGAPTLSISDATLIEGDSGTSTMSFTLNLQPPSAQSASVDWATAGESALSGTDFVAASGGASFTPGQTTRSVSVEIRGDTEVEADERLFVTISGAQNAQLGDAQAAGTILDDDAPTSDSVFGDGFE